VIVQTCRGRTKDYRLPVSDPARGEEPAISACTENDIRHTWAPEYWHMRYDFIQFSQLHKQHLPD
jgi:hypothetical protein